MAESYAHPTAMNPAVKRKPAKEFSHMEIRPAENGGAIVKHHFAGFDHEPEEHVFPVGKGKEMAAHIMKHVGMPMDVKKAQNEDSESGDTDD